MLGQPFPALIMVGALTHVIVLLIMIDAWRSAAQSDVSTPPNTTRPIDKVRPANLNLRSQSPEPPSNFANFGRVGYVVYSDRLYWASNSALHVTPS